MESLIAAIMLDREARSVTLDDDPNHGRAREPLLKILHMFRSMNLSTESGVIREIDMILLTDRGLGQESFNAPSVFSFFLSEYQPVGPVMEKGLVAPETQLFDAPKLISFVNGMFSLPHFGLADCQWWQGFGINTARYFIPDYPDGGEFECDAAASNNPGVPLRLRYTPPSWGGPTNVNNAPTSKVIDDIDLLLTGGR
jgi:cullin-associated NEDD8-dissociated protein 1